MSDQHVYSVLSVSLTILKTFPATLQIVAEGQTRTEGYTSVRLEPRIYIMPPADGIYEFDFVATPPTGPAATVIAPISTTYEQKMPPGLKGVRIYAETNELKKMLEYKAASGFAIAVAAGTTARGYSNKYDLEEAIQDAITQMPEQAPGEVDHLSHYTVVRIGAEIGGIAGLSRLYVDVKQ